ncbi:MAG: ATP-binding protein [Bacteroidota bacterium]
MKHKNYTFLLLYWILLTFFCSSAVHIRANGLEAAGVKVTPSATSLFDKLVADATQLTAEEQYTQALFAYQEAWELPNLSLQQQHLLHYELAFVHHKMQQYDNALAYLATTLEQDDDIKLYVKALALKGDIYKEKGNFSKAFPIYFELLRHQEQDRDSTGITHTNYDLGTLYYYQDNYAKALDFYQHTYQLAERIGDERYIFNALAAMGSTYNSLDSLDTALRYNKASLELAQEQSYQTGIAYALHNLGNDYIKLDDLMTAQTFFKRSIALKKRLSDSWGIVGSQIALADVQIKMGQYQAALNNLTDAEQLATQKGMQARLLKIYDAFATVHESNRQWKTANVYLKKKYTLKKTLFNEETTRQMKAAQEGYEIQSRDAAIQLLTVKNVAMREQQQLRNILLSSAIIFAVLTTLGMMYIFRNLQQVQQLNASLEISEARVREQMEALEASNKNLENFAYVASHDLREPLRMMRSFSSVLQRRYSEQLDKSGQECLRYINDGAERMDNMLVNLLDFSRLGNGNTQLQPTELSSTFFKALHSLQVLIQQKNVQIHVDYDQLPKVMGNDALLGQLFQNLVANGIKFNRTARPTIDIFWEERDEVHVLGIKDNGIGISEADQQKVFQMFHRLHHRQEFEGTGIGLATCKKIVDLHKGKIWVESEQGKGSTFYVALQKASANVAA